MLIVSLIIIFSGVEILRESIMSFLNPEVTSHHILPLSISMASAITLYLLSHFKKKVGERIGSQSLVSDGKHSMVDVYSSALAFTGILFSSIGYPWAEVLAGLVIGGYVVKVGLGFVRDAVLILMDACIMPSRLKEMKALVEEIPRVRGVHDIKMRKSGLVLFGEMHVEVGGSLSVEKGHEIADIIEEKVKERFPDIETITIHIEPGEKERRRIAIPISKDEGFDSMIEPHFGKAPLFAIVDIGEGGVEGIQVIENPGLKSEKGKGVKAARSLLDNGVDTLLVGKMGEGPFHTLRDNLVEIYRVPRPISIREAIDLLKGKSLEPLRSP